MYLDARTVLTLTFMSKSNQWDVKPNRSTAKVAHTVKEAYELIDASFEYVGKIQSAEIFRKPKRKT